jgi:hypothetical protein
MGHTKWDWGDMSMCYLKHVESFFPIFPWKNGTSSSVVQWFRMGLNQSWAATGPAVQRAQIKKPWPISSTNIFPEEMVVYQSVTIVISHLWFNLGKNHHVKIVKS